MDVQLELKLLEIAYALADPKVNTEVRIKQIGEKFRALAAELGYKIEKAEQP